MKYASRNRSAAESDYKLILKIYVTCKKTRNRSLKLKCWCFCKNCSISTWKQLFKGSDGENGLNRLFWYSVFWYIWMCTSKLNFYLQYKWSRARSHLKCLFSMKIGVNIMAYRNSNSLFISCILKDDKKFTTKMEIITVDYTWTTSYFYIAQYYQYL